MIEDVNGNRKLFWKEVSNVKGGELQQNKGWHRGRAKCERSGSIILKICII